MSDDVEEMLRAWLLHARCGCGHLVTDHDEEFAGPWSDNGCRHCDCAGVHGLGDL